MRGKSTCKIREWSQFPACLLGCYEVRHSRPRRPVGHRQPAPNFSLHLFSPFLLPLLTLTPMTSPLPNKKRKFPQLTDQIYGLIGANVSIFLLWQYATTSWQRFRDPSLYQWMTKNFVLNEYNMMAGRIWTLLTACFSHSSGTHIFMNCLGLYFIAPAVAS